MENILRDSYNHIFMENILQDSYNHLLPNPAHS